MEKTKIRFIEKQTTWEDMPVLKREYMETLASVLDAFWDGNVYQSNPYVLMEEGGQVAGFYAIGTDWAGHKILTAYYMRKRYLRYAQRRLERIISEHSLYGALVPSCDEEMVSLCMEKMKEWNTTFDMQAYNFCYSKDVEVRKAEFGPETIRKVPATEYLEANKKTEGQWEENLGEEGFELYKLIWENEVYGYAGVVRHKLDPSCVDIGNYVIQEHRRKGVGRSLLIHMTNRVLERENIPTVGCWYYNHNSKRTIESSGYVSKTRIFYVKFQQE